jgi:hypothetical protein
MLLAIGLAAAGQAVAADPPRLALFPTELFDTSLQGEVEGIDPADEARLALIDQELRARLATSGRYRPRPRSRAPATGAAAMAARRRSRPGSAPISRWSAGCRRSAT